MTQSGADDWFDESPRPPHAGPPEDPLVGAFRRAGCVYAEEEVGILREHARTADELDDLSMRRMAGQPLEHLVGWVQFGDLRLSVGPGVFVPRQRSLLLARAAVDAAGGFGEPVVLEAFCGVAPIASSVAESVPAAVLHVCDVDSAALAHARRNLPPNSGIHLGSLLEPVPAALRGHLDVIAAVPPYVPDAEIAFLAPEARDHEPRRALTGGPDGLDHIAALVADARRWLRAGGDLLMEMHTAQFDLLANRLETDVDFGVDAIEGDDGHTVVARLRRRRAG